MKKIAFFFTCFVLGCASLIAQDDRANYPFGLKNMYLNANFGVINYNYSSKLLEEPAKARSITATTTFAGRFAIGYHFKNNWDAQLSVMRPAAWASYNSINIDNYHHSVWTNIWALSGRKRIELSTSYSLYVEAGLSNVARHGFKIDDNEVIKDAQYLSPLLGTGINYKLSYKWDASINLTYSPPREKVQQPATTFIAAGITYNLRSLDQNVIDDNASTLYAFPKHILQIGYTSDFLGFDINRQFSGGLKTSIPIFWNGDIFIENGVFMTYQRNIFHTNKNFSLDWGASFALYKTQNHENFYALSVYPLVRWWFLRTTPVDLYFNYSIIGPAYISKSVLDGVDSGEEATFQDFMGIGFLFGKERNYNLDLKIAHYSNGNIFNDNHGIAIPLTISLGYAIY